MSQRAILLFLVLLFAPMSASADEPAPPKSILKVYRVGNLVSADALRKLSGGSTTSEEWASDYPETHRSLNDLQEIVEKMCSEKPLAVAAYEPTLSLIVRHTQQGHDEIDELLKSIAKAGEEKIRLHCRTLFYEGDERFSKLEAKDSARIYELVAKRRLPREEAKELESLVSFQKDAAGEAMHRTYTTDLKPGRRTAWGEIYRPCTAMGRVNADANSVDLRIDFIADDYKEEKAPMASQSFSLKEGDSGILVHYCDGGTVYWIVTAEVFSGPMAVDKVAAKN